MTPTEFAYPFHNRPKVGGLEFILIRNGKNRSGSTPYANKRNRKRKNKPKRK